ncbi:50S ribosomal protein L19 [Metamycoplasma hyosynoviae]|uniref:Large ribosomal subunit protein bL19 n=1 Tax=Metamycoplasma hyosynoviae TaxID=29559 RepID=A0A063YE62_9BACT|nr:50S ribosomal protein L19 [Metamycoplasma hyosynoviae]KDE42587.1 50S ribosomal protein L19 [Metamycoplasma hyosynoviae]MDC8901284.1 50S ribosomal protein L19 [Metamycoplasma hyosynoviae]MDC8912375.1 50S ribosomal protein L19 [Metamycoplasma hyosynoviae]MDC8913267.1 50S ribosomal protein L19 [Metamycoplasma hyosynoviae]MDC8914312.1 50S ribosomal protein L19 [Metamycoplasma hyosynoviae]
MRTKLIESVESEQIRKDLPEVREGYNVRVHVRIKEGNKERIQVFEGLVIAAYGEGINKSIQVRKDSYGIGVERIFKINSPLISSIEVTRKNKVRRAKLFYMRNLTGKSARLKEIKANQPAPAAKKTAAEKVAKKTAKATKPAK